jgi:hypothetical protein
LGREKAQETTARLRDDKATQIEPANQIPLFTRVAPVTHKGYTSQHLQELQHHARHICRPKAQLVDLILGKVKLDWEEAAVIKEVQTILGRASTGNALANELYRHYFNLVDINGRLFQSVAERHRWNE